MSLITYPVRELTDDAGTPLTAPVVTIASVTDKVGNAIASPAATVNLAGYFLSVDYDAQAKGEAIITFAVSQVGSTVTGLNAAPKYYCAKDSSVLAANLDAAVSTRLATSGYTAPTVPPTPAQIASAVLSDVSDVLGADIVAIKAKTDTFAPAPTAAQILAVIKADADWQTMLANVNGVFDYNETTRVLTLKDKAGAVTLATLTLTPGTAAFTHRASA